MNRSLLDGLGSWLEEGDSGPNRTEGFGQTLLCKWRYLERSSKESSDHRIQKFPESQRAWDKGVKRLGLMQLKK